MKDSRNRQSKVWFLAPGKFRQEIGDVINITDLAAGKIMSVVRAEKKVDGDEYQGGAEG